MTLTVHLRAADGATFDLRIPGPVVIVPARRAAATGRVNVPTVRGQVKIMAGGTMQAVASMRLPTVTT